MKKRNYLPLLGVFAFLLLSFLNVKGQSLQIQSKEAINKTAITIQTSIKAVNQGKNYTGDLSKALNHQYYAIQLYKQGNYELAIFHSRHARFTATKAIRANGYVIANGDLGIENFAVQGTAPTPKQLEEEVKINLASSLNDDSAIQSAEDITVE